MACYRRVDDVCRMRNRLDPSVEPVKRRSRIIVWNSHCSNAGDPTFAYAGALTLELVYQVYLFYLSTIHDRPVSWNTQHIDPDCLSQRWCQAVRTATTRGSPPMTLEEDVGADLINPPNLE